jgi:hypothetical protein
MNVEVERAGTYLDAAKINQENLWKRRGVEWKIAFSLWSALGAFTIFISSITSIPLWFVIVLPAVYFSFVLIHRKLLKALTISSQKDLELVIYYSTIAAWELNNQDFENRPARPEWSSDNQEKQNRKKREEKFISERSNKLEKRELITLVTSAISVLSYLFVLLKFFE